MINKRDVTHEFFISKVHVIPRLSGFDNAISKIEWVIIFKYGAVESMSAGETILDVYTTTPSIEIADVTAENIKAWVLAAETKNGYNMLDRLLDEYHLNILELKAKEAKMVEWNEPIAGENRWIPKQV